MMNENTSLKVTTIADTGTIDNNNNNNEEIINFYPVTPPTLLDNTYTCDSNNNNGCNNCNNELNNSKKPFVFIKRVTTVSSGQEIQSIAFTRGDRRTRFLEWEQLYKDDEEVKLLKKLMDMYRFPCREDEKSSCNREEMNIENIDDMASSAVSKLESDYMDTTS